MKTYKSIVLLCVLASAAGLVFISCSGPGKFGRMGAELLADGKYQAAIEMFDKALQGDTTEQYLMGRAKSAMRLARYDIAIRDYSVVINRKGMALPAAHLGRGEAYRNINSLDQAVRDYSAALNSTGGSIDRVNAYFLRAGAYRALGRYDPALSDCQHAIDRDPSRGPVYKRGDIFADMGNIRAATENYTAAQQRFRAGRREQDVIRVAAKMQSRAAVRQPAPVSREPQPSVAYRVEAADPRMRLVGEYLLLKPINQLAGILLKVVLGEVPDWQQDAWRTAAAQVNLKSLQDRHADIMGSQLSMMELETLVKMLRLERSESPAGKAELEALKFSEYGAQVLAREQVAFNELLKAYRGQLQGACRALGLGC